METEGMSRRWRLAGRKGGGGGNRRGVAILPSILGFSTWQRACWSHERQRSLPSPPTNARASHTLSSFKGSHIHKLRSPRSLAHMRRGKHFIHIVTQHEWAIHKPGTQAKKNEYQTAPKLIKAKPNTKLPHVRIKFVTQSVYETST